MEFTADQKGKVAKHLCEPVVRRLMYEYKWSRENATQWFHDFMCWLYSAQRWKHLQQNEFLMDSKNHYLDSVWHSYILHTNLYMDMCRTLFGVEYIHHIPDDPFTRENIEEKEPRKQLEFLLEDWGEEFMRRVWAYSIDRNTIRFR